MRKCLAVLLFAASTPLSAQLDPGLFREMRWRHVGPFRGGRTVAAAGIPDRPNVFYIGVNNGGVWKSIDYGRVWVPVFDSQPTGSIGALAIAPSNPDILYVGSGEGLQRPDLSTGDGIYKSVDGGKSWQHLGLRDGQQIAQIIIDPKDPDRLFVAVLGHPYGPNAERGIFRSTDGGKTFEKVLYRDENTGGIDVIFDPSNPRTVYAALWETRQAPWENGVFTGPGSGLFKSTDGGTTWKELSGGLPRAADKLGRIGLEIARTEPNRLFAVVDAAAGAGGLFRSDDGGETWRRINEQPQLWERGGDFNEVRVDPNNADVLYVANVVTWKSIDGGKTFRSFRGAPGGDDYHRVWINPFDSKILLIASDQGAIVTVNGGETWSSWYNQPTAQMFHVNADNAFPYRVCGGQQESGSACVETRSAEGRITYRQWSPVGAEEYGYAVPDPLDPDIVYGGRVSRFDRRTGQVVSISPRPLRDPGYRVIRTQPLVCSPADPHVLFFASNTVWKTTSGGKSWSAISPDLTRREWGVPANVGVYAKTPEAQPRQRGVVYALAPSPLDVNRLWAGTDDGLIHVTTDGGAHWTNVTPPQLVPWAKVSIMEASHFDVNTAYAAINTFRLDDLRPHILRTRDGGRTWSEIVTGIPAAGIINVVREDPKRRGLLFAGSETEVYVSFDDGSHWQSLRLNMPASSIRDLIVHGDDIAVATHGRGFWILDDITPLRQLDARSGGRTMLFEPQQALRWRWNLNTDTPLPPDEPSGENPPDGAILDYLLAAPADEVTLTISDAAGKVVRRYSSRDAVAPVQDEGNVPWYWIRPQRVPATGAGMHRFVWDLHYTPLPGKPSYPIAAVPFDTPPSPTSPWVLPGTYSVTLQAGGVTQTQPLVVKMDPRVKTPREGLAQQFTLSMRLYEGLQKLAALPKSEANDRLAASLRSLLDTLQDADVAPAESVVAAVESRMRELEAAVGQR